MSDNVHSLTGAPRPGESISLLGILETEFQDMSCMLSDQLTGTLFGLCFTSSTLMNEHR